jgi:hypothetical protein
MADVDTCWVSLCPYVPQWRHTSNTRISPTVADTRAYIRLGCVCMRDTFAGAFVRACACACLDFFLLGGGEDRYAEAAWAGARLNHPQLQAFMPTAGHPRVDQDTPQDTPALDTPVLDTPVVVMNQAHTNPQRREHMEQLTRQMGWSNVTFPPTKKWSELDLDELIADHLVPH